MSKNSKKWFKPVRWSYLPASWQGVLLYVLMIAFVISAFVAIDRNSHSVSDTLYSLFVFVVCTVAVMHWIASHKS